MIEYAGGKRRAASATVRSNVSSISDGQQSRVYTGRPSSAPPPGSSVPSSPSKLKRNDSSYQNLKIEGKSVRISYFIFLNLTKNKHTFYVADNDIFIIFEFQIQSFNYNHHFSHSVSCKSFLERSTGTDFKKNQVCFNRRTSFDIFLFRPKSYLNCFLTLCVVFL